jgi:hypothetical protein
MHYMEHGAHIENKNHPTGIAGELTDAEIYLAIRHLDPDEPAVMTMMTTSCTPWPYFYWSGASWGCSALTMVKLKSNGLLAISQWRRVLAEKGDANDVTAIDGKSRD